MYRVSVLNGCQHPAPLHAGVWDRASGHAVKPPTTTRCLHSPLPHTHTQTHTRGAPGPRSARGGHDGGCAPGLGTRDVIEVVSVSQRRLRVTVDILLTWCVLSCVSRTPGRKEALCLSLVTRDFYYFTKTLHTNLVQVPPFKHTFIKTSIHYVLQQACLHHRDCYLVWGVDYVSWQPSVYIWWVGAVFAESLVYCDCLLLEVEHDLHLLWTRWGSFTVIWHEGGSGLCCRWILAQVL